MFDNTLRKKIWWDMPQLSVKDLNGNEKDWNENMSIVLNLLALNADRVECLTKIYLSMV